MLLSITNEKYPATDLGFLLHKHPARCQQVQLNFGKALVFFPEATDQRCTACLLLDIDPVGMVRGKAGSRTGGPLDQYVNDRPYVASSFLSVAIAKVFGSAMKGKCDEDRPELADIVRPLTVRLSVMPCRGGKRFLKNLFEPLGYQVSAVLHILDEVFTEWGDSVYHTVELKKEAVLKEVLTHLYVLIPVLDNAKHYFAGEAEVENLLAKGEGWLAQHPEKEMIARRYLKHKISLQRQALSRLTFDDSQDDGDDGNDPHKLKSLEESLEKPLSLNEQRIKAVIAKILDSNAKTVIDLGCGEGKLLKELIRVKSIEKMAGMDVSIRSLEIAHKRIGLETQSGRLPDRIKDKIKLFQGSLMYKDIRFSGFDAAVVMEVVEHLDPPRLAAFERVLFAHARPKTVILTTPNREYNALWENLPEGAMRHSDHRFEWTREEFKRWAGHLAEQYGFTVSFFTIGPDDPAWGSPTQMGVFHRED